MNVLSLFDGISCGRVALERANIPITNYYSSEIDKYAIKISEKNYPNIIRLGDIKTIDIKTLPKIDLLIGGSPCTDFSVVGKQKGMSLNNKQITSLNEYLTLKEFNSNFEGSSYLFWEYVRILKELKPKYFLLENVVMKNEWRDLISEVIGVKPIMIDSRNFSAQKRRRYYWTNIPIDEYKDKGILLNDIIIKEDREDFNYISEARINLIKRKVQKGFVQKLFSDETTLKAECLLANMYKSMQSHVHLHNGKIRCYHPIECERLQTLPDNYTEGISNTQRYKCLGNGWTVDVITHIFKNIK